MKSLGENNKNNNFFKIVLIKCAIEGARRGQDLWEEEKLGLVWVHLEIVCSHPVVNRRHCFLHLLPRQHQTVICFWVESDVKLAVIGIKMEIYLQ